ncbi:hypothetical protein GCM10011385_18560 [Nitratireductor aestuarii]|uniref:Uncharacterized protein n=1 Tax=Nitratireductor aestuarii TaxID=1735103 RepID=A0A916RT13_9HYPH|nr:hypothetical protein [Nitratireductor aestuarii]GGA65041.1 hypothetical protein GCM10011385_18560 [Nitratireductor aestuarii]
MTFSAPIERSIKDFSARMGLDVPRGPREAYRFQFSSGCSFTLTAASDEDRTIATLMFKPRFWDDNILEKLFDLAGHEWKEGRLLRPSVTLGREITLAIVIDDEAMSVQGLDDCLRKLLELSRSLRQA